VSLVRVKMLEDFERPVAGDHAPARHKTGEFYLVPYELAEAMAAQGAVAVDEATPEQSAVLEAMVVEVHKRREALLEELRQDEETKIAELGGKNIVAPKVVLDEEEIARIARGVAPVKVEIDQELIDELAGVKVRAPKTHEA